MRKRAWAVAACAVLLWTGVALADTPAKAPPGVDCLITEWGFSPYDAGVVGFTGVASDGAQCGGEGDTNDPKAVPSDALGSINNVRALVLAMSAPDWGANVGPAAKFSDELEAELKAAGVNLGWVYQKLYQNSGEPEPAWVPKTPQKPYVDRTSESGATSSKTSEKRTTTVQDPSGRTATVTESGGETTVTTTDRSGKSETTALDQRTAEELRKRLLDYEQRMSRDAVTPVALPGGTVVEVPGGGLNEGFERAAASETADVWAAAAAAQRRFQARLVAAVVAVVAACLLVALLLVLGRLGVLAAWRREIAWRVEGWRYARRQGRW